MRDGPHPSAPAGPLAEELAGTALTLARAFAGGATLWCVSPGWPSHGAHVAVEFVHPVIVGKRALPAVHIADHDPAPAIRLLSRPGDVLLAVGAADDPVTADIVRRAGAWGLIRIWLGAGSRPDPPPAVDHIIWVGGTDARAAARSGDLVLSYHLLWELTHVVFGHPGLLAVPPRCSEDVCITCSDAGEVAEIRDLHEGAAEVVVGGRSQTVDVSLVGPLAPGDLVLVHAGVAITALDITVQSDSGRRL